MGGCSTSPTTAEAETAGFVPQGERICSIKVYDNLTPAGASKKWPLSFNAGQGSKLPRRGHGPLAVPLYDVLMRARHLLSTRVASSAIFPPRRGLKQQDAGQSL